ncbi:hypothetical protein pb186bvf_003585 [Paramecium bursaria]
MKIKQFLQKYNVDVGVLLSDATFLPFYGMNNQQKLEHKTIFTNISLDNNRNLGTVVGMTVLGFLGFVSLGFTIFGAIGGGVLGILLGRYIGQKISKKIASKGTQLTKFDLLSIRIKCVLRWCELMTSKYEANLNLHRFVIERLLTEIKPLLHYKLFDKTLQAQSVKILKKVKIFLTQKGLYCVGLSYKLTKEYIKIIEKAIIYSKFQTNQIQVVLAETVQDVLQPFCTLYHDDNNQGIIADLVRKIENLLKNQTVIEAQQVHVDKQLTLEEIKLFVSTLQETVKIDDIEKILTSQTYRQQNQSIPIRENKSQTPQRRQSLVDPRSYEDVENEMNAQAPNQFAVVKQNKRSKSLHHFKIDQGDVIIEINKEDILNDLKQEIKQESKQESKLEQKSEIKQESKQESKLDIKADQIFLQIEPQEQFASSHKLQGSRNLSEVREFNLSSELKQRFEVMRSLLEEPVAGWDLVLQKENIIIYRTFKPGNPAVFVKGFADLPGVSKDTLYFAIHDEQYRKKWDKILVDFQILEKESPIVDIMYYYVKSPFGVDNREFCQKRIVRQNFPHPGQTSLLYFSVDHVRAPKYKNHVRAETHIAGYIMEETKQGARLHFCTNNDVKGDIPKVFNSFNLIVSSQLCSFKSACQLDKIYALSMY